MDRRSDHHGGNVRRGRGNVRCLECGYLRPHRAGHSLICQSYAVLIPRTKFPKTEEEEAVSRLPPLGLASSTRSRTGQVAICLLDIDRRLSRGGNVLSLGRLENFLRTLDFLDRVAMYREQNFALLQATFVSLGFEIQEYPCQSGRQ
jgi:hypothetical protein